MTAPGSLPVHPLASAASRGDLNALEALLGRPVASAERVGTGRNSRIYRVRCGGEEYAAKFYFGPTADGRDRLEVEFSALQFLWRRGVRCIPQPLRADPARQLALYPFVGGEPVEARSVSSDDLVQLLSFVGELRRIGGDPEARALPPAAEAFFTVAGVVGNVRRRLERLQAHGGVGPAYDALRHFLRDAFSPALDRFAASAEAAGLGELGWPYRALSPSDLGFHNALRAPDGRLTFLDFEYFGWDDPAKTLSDALLHPRMQLAAEHRLRLAEAFDGIFGADPDWRRRVELLYPLFALKWCMIMLNEFRPEQIARRRYVDRSREEVEVIQMRQLEAGRALLGLTVGEQGRFPYWAGGRLRIDLSTRTVTLDERSRWLRKQIVRVLERAGRGHIGGSLSAVEILRVLFDEVLRYDPKNPKWPERDRFILSKGHGCIALYVLLQEKGFFPEEELWKFCRFDGILGGHPDPKVPGIEISTGSLGHGLPVAVGMAVAAKRRGASHRVFAVLSDGECDEGSVWEAAMSAAKHRLENLVVIVDYNKVQSSGTTYEILDLEPFAAKWEAFGFATREVDGHDVAALRRTFADLPFAQDRPSAVIGHTVKGKGVSFAEYNAAWHHKNSFKPGEIETLMRAIEAAP